ncbi:hemoglobin subunit beta-1-like [Megalobrama amblycephala]|uniref:hemoglobin subunit beta-1-like n=1 Tax=Megalobrama amblycephala TaxID=75352 RepID=UPI0020140A71|nr:hemoglobin subunit beta-1-like [Megalobrama amblycephala]
MVEWADAERQAIKSVWGKINVDVIGPKVLARCLIVYPWTQRYFGSFGSLSDVASIMGNKKVAAHGKVVLNGLRLAVQNMDDIKNTYAPLSVLHSEKLHVDPDNFRLLGDCLTIVVASQLGHAFTPDIQAAWQKFLAVVISALGKQYH